MILDAEGRPQFYELLRRRGRGEPVFYVFDLLWLDGEDLRDRPLIERKSLLRSIVPAQPSILLYADRIEREGVQFFRLTCERRDLEGIVAKVKHGAMARDGSRFEIRVILSVRGGGSCLRASERLEAENSCEQRAVRAALGLQMTVRTKTGEKRFV